MIFVKKKKIKMIQNCIKMTHDMFKICTKNNTMLFCHKLNLKIINIQNNYSLVWERPIIELGESNMYASLCVCV